MEINLFLEKMYISDILLHICDACKNEKVCVWYKNVNSRILSKKCILKNNSDYIAYPTIKQKICVFLELISKQCNNIKRNFKSYL